MSQVMIVEDVIDRSWRRKLHAMANSQDALEACRASIPTDAKGTSVQVAKEAGSWHLRAAWPLRARIDLPIPLGVWPMMAWWFGDGKVSTAMIEGGLAFAVEFGLDPMFAYIKQIPPKAQEFVEVGGVVLIRADWVPDFFIAIARGGMQQLNGGRNGR